MIIKLTPDEIKKYVAVALNLHSGAFDLEIVRPDETLLAVFRQVVNEFPGCRTYDKIPAIKKFRDLVQKGADGHSSIGLADAKWAVENVAEAIRNLETTGKLHA